MQTPAQALIHIDLRTSFKPFMRFALKHDITSSILRAVHVFYAEKTTVLCKAVTAAAHRIQVASRRASFFQI